MARLDVTATINQGLSGPALVVSVTGADDGVARSGLGPDSFEVHKVGTDLTGPTTQYPVAQVIEGPSGVYAVTLANSQDAMPAESPTLSVTVNGSSESGWADDRGQTLAVSGT